MDKEKIVKKIDEVGHAIDDQVEAAASKHNFTKFQVWVAVAVGAMAVVGVVKLLGWL